MIKFVEKKYSRIPENERFVQPPKWIIPESWKRYKDYIDIIQLLSYTRDFNKRTGPIWREWRKDLKKVRKEITDGYIFDDRVQGTTLTHYYPSESEPGKRYYVSKFINGSDRLMYNIYAPKLIKMEEEKRSCYLL